MKYVDTCDKCGHIIMLGSPHVCNPDSSYQDKQTVGETIKEKETAIERNKSEYNRIWNAAIEAAAKQVVSSLGLENTGVEQAIRGLKK